MHSKDQIYELFDGAAKYEIRWINYITNNEVLGITESATETYTKMLVNQGLGAIGLKPLYEGEELKKNPYQHLDRLSDTKKEATTKANFFESGVTSYVQSSGVSGWDDF